MIGQKTGGRVAGTPNKRSAELIERLEALGCDPLEGLAKIAADPTIDMALRARVYADLLPYLYPKRRAVEMELSGGGLLEILAGLPIVAVPSEAERADVDPRSTVDVNG